MDTTGAQRTFQRTSRGESLASSPAQRRAGLALWWAGRRDGKAGIPAAGSGPTHTPTTRELHAKASEAITKTDHWLQDQLGVLDGRIGRAQDESARRREQLEAVEQRVAAASEGAARAVGGAGANAPEHQLARERDTAREASERAAFELTGLRVQRERLIDAACAVARGHVAYFQACVERYRAANLRHRRRGAADLAAGWTVPEPALPRWVQSGRYDEDAANGDRDEKP